MVAKIAVVVTDLVEDIELTAPVDAFKNAGHQVTTVGFEQGTVNGKHGLSIAIDSSIADVTASDFDALFIPGGFSPDLLRADERFVAFTKNFLLSSKIVACLCHGPQLLIQTGLVHGRKMTAYLTVMPDLYYAGAQVEDCPVVTDNNLITSREPKDIPYFNAAVLEALKKA